MRTNEIKDFIYNEFHDSGVKEKGIKKVTIKIIKDTVRKDLGMTFERSEVVGGNLSSFHNSTWGKGEVGSTKECNLACLYGIIIFI